MSIIIEKLMKDHYPERERERDANKKQYSNPAFNSPIINY